MTRRPLPVRRSIAAAALAPLLVTGLAACGDDGSDDSSASDATSQVADSDAESASDLEEGQEVDPDEFMKTVSEGLEASTTAHTTMTMTLGTMGEMNAEGDIDYTTDPPSLAMTMASPMGEGDMDIRMVDGIIYTSMGELTDGKFLKLDPKDPDSPLGSLGMDSMLDQLDPRKSLETMADGISQVVYVGEEDGLDHFELTVDMAQFLNQMGEQLPPGAEKDVPETITYELWLDDEGRFARLVMDDLDVAGETTSMEMTMSEWGEEVDIEAPPADQITEMPQMPSAPAA